MTVSNTTSQASTAIAPMTATTTTWTYGWTGWAAETSGPAGSPSPAPVTEVRVAAVSLERADNPVPHEGEDRWDDRRSVHHRIHLNGTGMEVGGIIPSG